jgi:hypothetical protein
MERFPMHAAGGHCANRSDHVRDIWRVDRVDLKGSHHDHVHHPLPSLRSGVRAATRDRPHWGLACVSRLRTTTSARSRIPLRTDSPLRQQILATIQASLAKPR